ncbi:hypothetical protein HY988_04525 [Candidatus Micrarchaeota archaeon]|nr:hypothetical protein [Candidatus Micrarchaeota archaeon]
MKQKSEIGRKGGGGGSFGSKHKMAPEAPIGSTKIREIFYAICVVGREHQKSVVGFEGAIAAIAQEEKDVVQFIKTFIADRSKPTPDRTAAIYAIISRYCGTGVQSEIMNQRIGFVYNAGIYGPVSESVIGRTFRETCEQICGDDEVVQASMSGIGSVKTALESVKSENTRAIELIGGTSGDVGL